MAGNKQLDLLNMVACLRELRMLIWKGTLRRL